MRTAILLILLLLSLGASTGCSAVGFLGALEESRRRNSTRPIEPEYTGLAGKSVAVVVAADRIIESDHPEIVIRLTQNIAERLAEFATGEGGTVLAPEKVLAFQYNTPRWTAMAHGDLARELGVQRLVYVDLFEYRLNDPGNQYLWEGVAAGDVAVVEADSAFPDEFAFQKSIRVTFPDQGGYGPGEYTRSLVTSALSLRFVDRASWLFYKHEEPYYPDY